MAEKQFLARHQRSNKDYYSVPWASQASAKACQGRGSPGDSSTASWASLSASTAQDTVVRLADALPCALSPDALLGTAGPGAAGWAAASSFALEPALPEVAFEAIVLLSSWSAATAAVAASARMR